VSGGDIVIATGQPASAIRALSDAFLRDINAADAATDPEQFVQLFYADDARFLPPNQPMVTGRAQIRDAFRDLLVTGFGELAAETVDIGSSGDLAYRIGTYLLGRPAPDRGKFIEIYRRQADGMWRCVADMFNSDLAGG
jgi:ketosteroid isomerase-like protein